MLPMLKRLITGLSGFHGRVVCRSVITSSHNFNSKGAYYAVRNASTLGGKKKKVPSSNKIQNRNQNLDSQWPNDKFAPLSTLDPGLEYVIQDWRLDLAPYHFLIAWEHDPPPDTISCWVWVQVFVHSDIFIYPLFKYQYSGTTFIENLITRALPQGPRNTGFDVYNVSPDGDWTITTLFADVSYDKYVPYLSDYAGLIDMYGEDAETAGNNYFAGMSSVAMCRTIGKLIFNWTHNSVFNQVKVRVVETKPQSEDSSVTQGVDANTETQLWGMIDFPITPHCSMRFFDGHSFYIPNGTTINPVLTRTMNTWLNKQQKSESTSDQYYMIIVPVLDPAGAFWRAAISTYVFVAYQRNDDYPLPIEIPANDFYGTKNVVQSTMSSLSNRFRGVGASGLNEIIVDNQTAIRVGTDMEKVASLSVLRSMFGSPGGY